MGISLKSVGGLLLRRRRLALALLAVLAAVGITTLTLLPAAPASAHCDSVNGPVATAAREALERKDVKIVLPYVKAEQEQELTIAFEQTLAIRKRSEAVRQVADRYFIETAVRLHRVGEGASYTGLKENVEANPALEAAEKSLNAGTSEQVIMVLDAALRQEVAKRFQGVLDARAAEKAHPSVETSRERVEAELTFEKYAVGILGAINGTAAEDEGASHAE
jgi:hypothetical protein